MKVPAFLSAKPQPAGIPAAAGTQPANGSAPANAPPAWGPVDLPPRRHWLGWAILGAVVLLAIFIIARTPGLPGTWMQDAANSARTRPAAWLLALLAIGMLGVYPVAYLAYLGFGADAQRKRLRDDFQLFGLVAEDKLDETIDKLYQHVYSWPQFVAYIALIEFISVAVLAAFIARVTIASSLSDNIILIVTFGYLGAYVFSVQELIRRYNTYDMQPQVFSSSLVRFLISIVLTFVLGSILFTANPASISNQPVIAIVPQPAVPQPAASPAAPAARPAGTAPGVTTAITATQPVTPSASSNIAIIPASAAGSGTANPVPAWAIIVAFAIGIFPSTGIRWFLQQANRVLQPPSDQSSDLPLRNLLGMSEWHEARLGVMGIDDAQNLATVDIAKLLLTTQFDTQQVANWIDQSILYVKVGSRIERFREAKIYTFHQFLAAFDELAGNDLALGGVRGQPAGGNQGQNNGNQDNSLQGGLAATLGLFNADELRRLRDYSNFPNYAHIADYYAGTLRVGSQRAEESVQRLIGDATGLFDRLRLEQEQDPDDLAQIRSDLLRLLQQPRSMLKDPEYCMRLAERYYQLRQFDQAEQALTMAIDLNDKLAEAYFLRSQVTLAMAEVPQTDEKRRNEYYDCAITDIWQAIALKPGDPLAYNHRGALYNRRGEYDQAIADFTEALNLNHRLGVTYYNRAIARNARNLLDDALADIETAELLGQDQFGLWYAWGVMLLARQNWAGAIQKFTEAILRNPSYADAYANRGAAYMNMRPPNYAQAGQDLQRAVALNPNLYNGWNQLGILAGQQGQPEQAVDYYQRALTVKEDYFLARYNLAQTYNQIMAPDKALAEYRRLYQMAKKTRPTPEQSADLEALAETLDVSQKFLSNLQQALQLSQQSGDQREEANSRRRLAMFYARLGEDVTARGYYQGAIAIYKTLGDTANQQATEQELAALDAASPAGGSGGQPGAQTAPTGGNGSHPAPAGAAL